MKLVKCVVAGAFLTLSTIGTAGMTLSEYEAASKAQGPEAAEEYLTGALDALVAANAMLSESGQAKMFCQPAGEINVSDAEVSLVLEATLSGMDSDRPVVEYMLLGLQRKYPC